VHRLAIVASLLLVPPIAMRIAKLTLYWRGIDVATVL